MKVSDFDFYLPEELNSTTSIRKKRLFKTYGFR